MKLESHLFSGFIENLASKTFTHLVEEMGFSSNPVELLNKALIDAEVTAVYRAKNLFIFGNIVDVHVETPHGDYGMRISENDDSFELRISELTNYQVINTFTLSKLQPSGLPDGA